MTKFNPFSFNFNIMPHIKAVAKNYPTATILLADVVVASTVAGGIALLGELDFLSWLQYPEGPGAAAAAGFVAAIVKNLGTGSYSAAGITFLADTGAHLTDVIPYDWNNIPAPFTQDYPVTAMFASHLKVLAPAGLAMKCLSTLFAKLNTPQVEQEQPQPALTATKKLS